jgi:hypothetical protein
VAQAGSFTVTPSAAAMGVGSASNYSFSYAASTHTVDKASLVLTARENTKLFDGTVKALAVPSVAGLLGTDRVSDLSQSYATAAVGIDKTLNVQTYRILDGNEGANYRVTLVQNDKGVIREVPVAVISPSVSTTATAVAVPAIGTVSAASTTGTPGISITTVNTPGQGNTGLITVTVPQSTAVSGVGLTIPLPESVIAPAGSGAGTPVAVTLSNNEPLPAWIQFDAGTKALVTSAVPSGALPISVAVTIGGLRSVIEISESQNK